jgi:hypothetical protein
MIRISIPCLLCLLLVGCLGSPKPYNPYIGEPRPAVEVGESETERTLRLAVPMEIERNEARRRQTRKVLARILGEIPNNPWNSFEDDIASTFEEAHESRYALGGMVPRDSDRASLGRISDDAGWGSLQVTLQSGDKNDFLRLAGQAGLDRQESLRLWAYQDRLHVARERLNPTPQGTNPLGN